MALSDDDVREILRIIDESPLGELHVETDGFSLHVLRGEPAGATSRPSLGGATEADTRDHRDGLLAIEAPMLGTFYRAEGAGREPFVEVGSRVAPDTTVCIIEVMKMMNSIPAGVAGTVVEVCSENAELVEYGQPLFQVEPE
jgi:acetyl-CoA carboxylase biotin carboxyl carrier protein